jgi:hypothetical protein
MAGTATNIMVSPALVYISPTGTALPDETTVAAGATWGAGWTDLGYTLTPVALGVDVETFELEVEQTPNPVAMLQTKQNASFEVTLAELTAANLKYALSSRSTITTTAAAANQHGFETLKVGGDTQIPYFQIGFEGVQLDASGNKLVKRLFIYKAVLTMGGKLEFSKKAPAGIPLRVTAVADTGKTAGEQLFEVQFVTAWKTS